MDQAQVAWVAGILEGEGCFHMERHRYPRIAVQMADKDIIWRLKEVTGVGVNAGPYWPTRWAKKEQWRWLVSKKADVKAIMLAVRPWMGERRGAKIDECLAFVPRPTGRPRRTRCPKGHPYEGDNLYVAPSGKRFCVTCYIIREGFPPRRGLRPVVSLRPEDVRGRVRATAP